MADKHPECPLYNPMNCKEFFNPKVCAVARKDKVCMKRKKAKESTPGREEGARA
jgi:hypothetical protein